MADLSVSVIGMGRLGRSLARLVSLADGYCVRDLLLRRESESSAVRGFVGDGRVVFRLEELVAADLYLLAVPDAAIADCARALAAADVVPAGSVVFHASGVSESTLLRPLAEKGAWIGSLHPAFSFADPARAVEGFAGTLCAVEGDERACQGLERFAARIGGRPFRLAAGGKAAYHASLSVASNYLVALTAMAGQLAGQAGVPADLAGPLLGGLMRQTLENALALGPYQALTGPIVRGDADTVAQHLMVLGDSGLAEAYRAMGRRTVALAGDRVSDAQREKLLALLS
ncbi:Rossmann-like and DUF2520 domain-containing protein [Chromobacterium sp. IIBBL 290-4]|uniref:Rossmann-like and DUF2520 domain-containing protein n=1 Tax=Chromobacterium sp. IIBBL 290-4 TaxID=2953890 RepID=UPI0020B72020|nr:Rossmann-like and DUF2520 domain-containing protein [Chromobacterium sp. IIBBL 290-4]UTH72683.1 DUF2520 domain-containing protein [Chromobacterium sp. IIBBL 290-4]